MGSHIPGLCARSGLPPVRFLCHEMARLWETVGWPESPQKAIPLAHISRWEWLWLLSQQQLGGGEACTTRNFQDATHQGMKSATE